MRRACITGGAGFIGSNLADRLTADGVEVVVVDDFRSGRREFVADLLKQTGATLIEGDVASDAVLDHALAGCDTVFHLQANADVRFGFDHPRRDIEQNIATTSAVLEAMRRNGVERIVFASTGSVYGEPAIHPTPESCPFPVQTSLYASSKVAAEGLISTYAHAFNITGVVLRFVSILGERYTHGHVFDFYRALKRDPTRLRVLGDGRQEKSYLYIGDCVEGILAALGATPAGTFDVFNLGTDETLVVDDSVRLICERLDVTPEIEHAGGVRGWPGDSPLILLDCTKLRAHGWSPRLGIEESVLRTLDWFERNQAVVLDEAVAR